jgi:hypothetical protein
LGGRRRYDYLKPCRLQEALGGQTDCWEKCRHKEVLRKKFVVKCGFWGPVSPGEGVSSVRVCMLIPMFFHIWGSGERLHLEVHTFKTHQLLDVYFIILLSLCRTGIANHKALMYNINRNNIVLYAGNLPRE